MLLTGTIGAGKTTLAEATSEQLHAAGIRHALLDLDWLGQIYPPPSEDDPFNEGLSVRNLASIWPNFIQGGIRHAVVAATVLARRRLDAIRTALAGCELTVVRVSSPPGLVAARLRRREVGSLLDDFLERTDSVATVIKDAGLEDFTVMNDDRPPRQLAAEILERLGWGSL